MGRSLNCRPLAGSLALAVSLAAVAAQPANPPARRGAEPMAMPRGVARALGDARIVIDGVVDEWPAASPLLLLDTRQVSGTAMRAYLGPSDLSAQAFLVWDAEDLYVAVKVKDDWHRPLGAKVYGVSEIPPADSVLLTFDPERDTRALGHDLGRTDDREFWLADVEGAGKGQVVLWNRFGGTATWVEGGALAVARDDQLKVTTYEARIPWKAILKGGRKPEVGMVFDFQIVVSDFDEVTDVMAQTRIGWTFGTGPRIDPGLLGSVMLLGDVDGPVIDLPEFPSPPSPSEDAVPGPRYWIELHDALRATRPVVFRADAGDPRAAIGAERRRRLETLDGHLAAFPRVDFLEFQQRIHRRMSRECAGIIATGLPYYWDHVLAEVRRRVEVAVPEHGVRVFRLPQSGWLVLSKQAKFAIDPAGYDVDKAFYEVLDFVLLTDPLDMTKRNDQLLIRMLLTGKAFASHVRFHLPGIDASKVELVQPGGRFDRNGLRIAVLGVQNEQGVSASVGYHVQWPDGLTIVHSGLSASVEQLPPDGRKVDLLILSAEHDAPAVAGQRIAAELTVLDDVFLCPRRPGGHPRVSLEGAFELQSWLLPCASVLLAPGESWTVSR